MPDWTRTDLRYLGDDWDELERKAAKGERSFFDISFIHCTQKKLLADQKRTEGKKAAGSDDSDDDRPKKKSAKTNGKSKTKR